MRFNDITKTKMCCTARRISMSIQSPVKKNSTRNSRMTMRSWSFIDVRAARRRWLTRKKTAESCILRSKKNSTRRSVKTRKEIRTRNLLIWLQRSQLLHLKQNSISLFYLNFWKLLKSSYLSVITMQMQQRHMIVNISRCEFTTSDSVLMSATISSSSKRSRKSTYSSMRSLM